MLSRRTTLSVEEVPLTEPKPATFDDRRVLAFLFTSVWWSFLLVVGGIKIVWVQDGIYAFVTHYTNWSWSFQFLFYTMDLVSYSDQTHNFKHIIIVAFFFISWGIAWLVYILVYLLIYLNPAIFDDNIEDYGTSMVLLVDRVFHNLPIAVNFAYVLINYNQFLAAYSWLRESILRSNYCLIASYLIVYSLIPAVLMMVFHLALDITKVYNISSSFEAGYVLVVFVSGLFVALPLAWLFFKGATLNKDK